MIDEGDLLVVEPGELLGGDIEGGVADTEDVDALGVSDSRHGFHSRRVTYFPSHQRRELREHVPAREERIVSKVPGTDPLECCPGPVVFRCPPVESSEESGRIDEQRVRAAVHSPPISP